MNKTIVHQSGNTSTTSFTRFYLPAPPTSTFQSDHITLDAMIAEAVSIIENDLIRTHYDLVPKRTIDDFLRSREADMARWPRNKYVDIDLPMVEDDGGD